MCAAIASGDEGNGLAEQYRWHWTSLTKHCFTSTSLCTPRSPSYRNNLLEQTVESLLPCNQGVTSTKGCLRQTPFLVAKANKDNDLRDQQGVPSSRKSLLERHMRKSNPNLKDNATTAPSSPKRELSPPRQGTPDTIPTVSAAISSEKAPISSEQHPPAEHLHHYNNYHSSHHGISAPPVSTMPMSADGAHGNAAVHYHSTPISPANPHQGISPPTHVPHPHYRTPTHIHSPSYSAINSATPPPLPVASTASSPSQVWISPSHHVPLHIQNEVKIDMGTST